MSVSFLEGGVLLKVTELSANRFVLFVCGGPVILLDGNASL